MKKTLLFLLLLAPTAAFAQADNFELTPTAGYHFRGDVSVDRNSVLNDNLDVKAGGSYGLTADIPLNQWLSVELLARRQQTELITDHGVFRNDEHFADLDIDYYHVGILFQIPSSRVVPYFVASLGLAHLDLDLPDTSKEDRGSASLGGGVKIYFNDHVGLRFEGRGYYIDLDNDNNDDSRDDRRRRDRWDDRNSITQTEASLGLILAF
ncbi:MAG: porin family protein [Thermoanaerobaculia bacterium]